MINWQHPDTEIRAKCLHAVNKELFKRYSEAYPNISFRIYTEALGATITIIEGPQLLSCHLTLSDSIDVYWMHTVVVKNVEPNICDEYLQELGFVKTGRDYGFKWQFSGDEKITKLIAHFPNDLDINVSLF